MDPKDQRFALGEWKDLNPLQRNLFWIGNGNLNV
jgi:hypothetical protein